MVQVSYNECGTKILKGYRVAPQAKTELPKRRNTYAAGSKEKATDWVNMRKHIRVYY